MAAKKVSIKRNFTLSELIESIDFALTRAKRDQDVVLEHSPALPSSPNRLILPSSAPSIQTLKNWSRNGLFDKVSSLDVATKLAMDNMRANARYYRENRGSQRADRQSGGLFSPPAHSGATSVATNRGDLSNVLGQEILNGINALNKRISVIEERYALDGRLNNPLNNVAGPQLLIESAHHSELIERVIKAIEQLDSTRRHVLQRMDSEAQLLRQSMSATSSAKNEESLSVLDAHRIMAKLTSVERLLQGLVIPPHH